MTALLELDLGHLLAAAEAARHPPESGPEARAFDRFRDALAAGELPPSEVLDAPAVPGPASELAATLLAPDDDQGGSGGVDTVVLLGIGGSSLGFETLLDALSGPHHNDFPGDAPRVWVIDNVDPALVSPLLAAFDDGRLDPRRTVLVYVSKSGSTPESAAGFLLFADRLRRAAGRLPRIVAISDPPGTDGPSGIERLVCHLGGDVLALPPRLGGRFSVLSSVGLFPATLVGLDGAGLLDGARAVHRATLERDAGDNPCFLLGALLHRLLGRRDADAPPGIPQLRNLHFLWSYSARLERFNAWMVQLWSESLGKRLDLDGREVRTGSTPVTALGATDQHSILQLVQEGPLDKVVGFLGVGAFADDPVLPRLEELLAAGDGGGHGAPTPDELPQYDYLGGHTLAEQLAAERLSTELAVARAGHPCYRLTLGRLDAPSLGALLYLWQLVVVWYAALEGVDPFDQPGVEEGKRTTYALLGRRGYRDDRAMEDAKIQAHLAVRRRLVVEATDDGDPTP